MLTADDKKEISRIVRDENDSMRESLVSIEQTFKVVLDLHQILVEHSEKLTEHDDRISVLEAA